MWVEEEMLGEGAGDTFATNLPTVTKQPGTDGRALTVSDAPLFGNK